MSRTAFIFFILSVTNTLGQVDSQTLLQKALAEPVDSTRCLLLIEYVSAIRESNNAEAMKYAEVAKDLAEKSSFRKGLGLAMENIGWMYYRKGNYSKSLQYSTDALKINREVSNWVALGNCLNNISAVLYEQKQYDKGLERLKEAWLLSKERGLIELENRTLNNIAYCYMTIHQIDSAKRYANLAIQVGSKSVDLSKQGFSLRTLGDIFLAENNYSEALKSFNKCLELAEKLKNNFLITSTSHRIAKIRFIQKDYQGAIQYLEKNIEISKKLDYKNELERSYKLLSEVYSKMGANEKALQYLQTYLILHDSLYSQQSAEMIALNQASFESDMKQAKIDLLTKDALLREEEIKNQRQTIYIFIISLSVVVILVVILINLNRKTLRINRELEAKNMQINLQAKQLGLLNATKDKLFSIIGHDLRSPVASLRGLLDLVNSSHLSQQEFLTFSKGLKSNLDYVHDDLDNLLSWARTQLGGFDVAMEYINIHKLVEEKINLFSETARGKGISLSNKVANDIEVYSDANHLQLILRNLIGNAIKFNNPGGSTEIYAHMEEDSQVEIQVRDSGRGMTVEEIGKLFHIGTHFTKPGTNNEKGMGIGLLLVKEFIGRSGGSISVQSEVGKGTTFTFTMKARKGQPALV